MALKAVLSKEELPAGLAEHYTEKDGKFYLSVEGMVPDSQLVDARQKVAEFRDGNIKILKERDDLASKLKGFDGVDVDEYKTLKEQTKKFKTKGVDNPDDIESLVTRKLEEATRGLNTRIQAIETEKTNLQKQIESKELEKVLAEGARAALVREKAMEDAITRGLRVFRNVDGKIVPMNGDTILYSPQDSIKPMTPKEFYESLRKDAEHLFEASAGGGATNMGAGATLPMRTLNNPTPMDIGKNLDSIAKGTMKVVHG
jgi:hypothetical protein